MQIDTKESQNLFSSPVITFSLCSSMKKNTINIMIIYMIIKNKSYTPPNWLYMCVLFIL